MRAASSAVPLLAVALFATLAGAAPVYKWTDKDGKVHFTDAPPPEAVTVQQLAIQSKPTDPTQLQQLDAQQELQKKQTAMEDELRTSQAKRAEEERADKQAACDAARKRYENLQHSRKFATTGADGKEAWMSGADADRMKADLKAAADKACAGL